MHECTEGIADAHSGFDRLRWCGGWMGERQGCEWCKRSAGSPRPEGKPPALCKRANAPLFVTTAGAACCTEEVRVLGGRCAAAADIQLEAVGGKLWCIGGAADYLEACWARRERAC